MDVLSTIAGLIAVGQALAVIPGIIDILRSISQARQELFQLVNDVELLSSFGTLIRETIDNLDDDSKARFRIPQLSVTLIERVRADLASIIPELEELARKCQQQGGQGNDKAKVTKFKWFKHKKQIASLSQRASKNCTDLQTILNLTSFLTFTSHGKMLVDIHAVVTSPRLQPQISPRQHPSQIRYIGDAPSDDVNIKSGHNIVEGNTGTSLKGDNQSNLQNVIEEAIRQPFPKGKPTEEPLVQLTAALRRSCARDCQCQCHSSPPRTRPHPATLPIHRWLNFAYNIIPRFGAQRCNVATCRRAYSPVYVNFRIPLLFCSRSLEASLSFNNAIGVGASLHLHVARMIPSIEWIWEEVEGNDLEMVRLRLLRREISPIDHTCFSKPGFMIELAILRGNYEIVELLLQQAASIVRGTGLAEDLAMKARYELRNWSCSEYEEYILRKVIALDEDADDYWPVLSKTAAERGDLPAILEDYSEDIALIDRFGQAPLHHAVENNDVNTTRRLLSHGADPNIINPFGDTPLANAATRGCHDCIYALIDGGCDINKVQAGRYNAFELLIMSEKEGSAEMASFLLKNGVCLSLNLVYGKSALHHLARNPQAAEIGEKFEMLVRAGVAVDAKYIYGYRPLDEAILHNNATMLRLLMSAGCMLNDTPENNNSLRLAAFSSNSMILGIVGEAEFTMDVRWRDKDGNTALDLFEWRMNTSLLPCRFQRPSGDEIEAFGESLTKVRDRYLNAEIQTLELVVEHLKEHSNTLAREILRHVMEEKMKWVIPAEYRTFRAIDVQIKEEMVEAAIESLEEFMEVSRSRIGTIPFVSDYCRAKGLEDRGLVVKDID
ncbi:ankyrin [Rostrohypoxylon terebratum]|nr:ankyrin [Rostrohypoxylon terebratum]